MALTGLALLPHCLGFVSYFLPSVFLGQINLLCTENLFLGVLSSTGPFAYHLGVFTSELWSKQGELLQSLEGTVDSEEKRIMGGTQGCLSCLC